MARRLGWFVLLWLSGTASLTIIAYVIRWVLHPG
ncbi:DUF2474 domain-containing protein [Pseudoroseomonas globiformis]|uniref:DUF2474 domain-containing protein n=1 Tax=Teichococcus globiformis TaxID=2307229 RepID=A0ABV7G1Q5_9PROT